MIQVATHKVTTGNETQSVSLTNCITTNDVYMLIVNNVCVGADGGVIDFKPMVDSSINSDSNIDVAWNLLRTNTGFQANGGSNQDFFRGTDGMTDSPDTFNCIFYFYNWFSSSEFSMFNQEATGTRGDGHLLGYQGGGMKDVTTSFNGINIATNQSGGGGFQNGARFTMYRLV